MNLRTVTEINSLARDEFVRIIGLVFEQSPWVAEAAWAKRPFASREALHAALCETVASAGADKQLGSSARIRTLRDGSRRPAR